MAKKTFPSPRPNAPKSLGHTALSPPRHLSNLANLEGIEGVEGVEKEEATEIGGLWE